jgi:hypothetical protein
MEASVKESEEAEHTAKTNEFGELEEFTKRRDAESEDEEAEDPIAGGVLESLDRIWAEIAGERSPYEKGERHEAKKKDGNFDPLDGEKRVHASDQPQ